MNNEKIIIEDEEIQKIIRKASIDLEDIYCKIKKSHKILKYKSNGSLINDIYTNIICHFSLFQILENSSKCKMINNDTNKEFNRKERFILLVNNFISTFEYHCKQHLELLDSKK